MFVFYFLLTISSPVISQQKAITETGESVILYRDGRWTYANSDTILHGEIPSNPGQFKKDNNATFLVKSTKMNIGFWIDPNFWTFKKSDTHEVAEFEFHNAERQLYGLSICENIELPMESLANIALANARDVAPDITLVKKEYRMVNGLKVLMLHMTGTIEDVLLSYYGYYYTSSNGAVQFLVYSTKESVNANQKEIEMLLNGLVEVKK